MPPLVRWSSVSRQPAQHLDGGDPLAVPPLRPPRVIPVGGTIVTSGCRSSGWRRFCMAANTFTDTNGTALIVAPCDYYNTSQYFNFG